MTDDHELSAATLLAKARSWMLSDPDPVTRAELANLLDKAEQHGDFESSLSRLRECFQSPLRFGTAGLRGQLGPGPAHFNVALVARTAVAVCRWLDGDGTRAPVKGPIVVGFDARHNSEAAAAQAVRQIGHFGREPLLLPFAAPTPLTAYAARRLGAAAALMVTASHNPATDNGVKVFGPDHRQIVAPDDSLIAALLDGVDSLAETADIVAERRLDPQIWEEYVNRCAALARSGQHRRKIGVAYSALHGVGADTIDAVFSRCGFDVFHVPSQRDPDPTFPTTAFPNPEEPGAMDLVLEVAESARADVAMVHDPDADRLAVAVPTLEGDLKVLTGDELGCVLLWFLATERNLTGTVASTLVSSELAAAICHELNLAHVITPTGFKWLSRVDGLAFAFEESIGYCVDPAAVTDKDGVSAAVVLADLIAGGTNPLDVLELLDTRFGAHVQRNGSLHITKRAHTRLRQVLLSGLPSLGGMTLDSVADLEDDPTGSGEGVCLRLSSVVDGAAARVRVVMRPSGTEPKTKVYVETIHPSREIAGKLGVRVQDAVHELAAQVIAEQTT